MPKISIITVNYNNASGLASTLESVRLQSCPNTEHIIIDGASNDGSVEILQEFADGIIYISERDSGVYEAMNKGIRIATAPYLLFLNSGDVFYSEDVLKRLIPKIETEDIYYGDVQFSSHNGVFIREYPKQLQFNYFLDRSLPHPASFIRKQLFEDFFYYNEDFKIVSDWEFFIYVICKGNATYQHLDEVVSVFKLDGISNDPKNKSLILKEKEMVFQKHFPEKSKEILEWKKNKLSTSNGNGLNLGSQPKNAAKKLSVRILKRIKRLFVRNYDS